jgi:predicted MFS family arabinose efflux permease
VVLDPLTPGGVTGRQRAPWVLPVAGVALIAVCYGLARFAYGLLTPQMQDDLDFGPGLSGLIASGSYVGYCVAILVSTALTQRFGPRPVAVLAAGLATGGMALMSAAPGPGIMAVGVVVAGASTGVASPPLAAAVAAWVREQVRDRTQTLVNAGTGVGVLVSGPIAIAAADQWRAAWAAFAVVAGVVGVAVLVAVPQGRPSDGGRVATGAGRPVERRPGPELGAVTRLAAGSLLMGLSSIGVWTLGRVLMTSQGQLPASTSAWVWTVLGAAGILGGLGGDLTSRVGVATAWRVLLLAMAGATAAFALGPGSPPVAFISAAVFGASYIGLTGVALVWSTRLYPQRAAFGVGFSFLMIALGQAVGAPVVGRLAEAFTLDLSFHVCATVALVACFVGPRLPSPTRR